MTPEDYGLLPEVSKEYWKQLVNSTKIERCVTKDKLKDPLLDKSLFGAVFEALYFGAPMHDRYYE